MIMHKGLPDTFTFKPNQTYFYALCTESNSGAATVPYDIDVLWPVDKD